MVSFVPCGSVMVSFTTPAKAPPLQGLRVSYSHDIFTYLAPYAADIPDGVSFHGVPRFYRDALKGLGRAIDQWNQQGDLDFSIHFGDILDGFQPKDKSHEALTSVLDEFERLGRPTYHLIGNHCLYNLERPILNDR